MIKLAMNKSTKNVLIATLPTVLTYAVGKVVRAISKRKKRARKVRMVPRSLVIRIVSVALNAGVS